MCLVEKIASALDNHLHTIGIYLDYSKAFDTVNHDILLHKLYYYGIRGSALEWFKSYLRNRQQFVQLNGIGSRMQSVTCGVPQGSLLGPLLFILYVNDFPKSSNVFSFLLFADDTSIFCSNKDLRVLLETVNMELHGLTNWIHANKLSLNLLKTKYMLFSNRDTLMPGPVIFDNVQIERVISTKFLGIHIDDKLNWKMHTTHLCNLLSRNVGMMNKLKSFLPNSILAMLYSSLILPYLNYGVLAWGATAKTRLEKILLLQKRAVRIMSAANAHAHTDTLFYGNNVLKIQDIYLLYLASLMYQINNGNVPHAIASMFVKNDRIHNYCTRQAALYHFTSVRTQLRNNTVALAGPKYWNSLQSSFRQAISLSGFKRKMKSYLLDRYNES